MLCFVVSVCHTHVVGQSRALDTVRYTMKITEKDFDLLTDTVMGWNGNDWHLQNHRFLDDVSFDWKVCYWVESATSMILARTFLEQNGHKHEVSYDEALESFVLLTNFDSHRMAITA
jgi:hypothetical protein